VGVFKGDVLIPFLVRSQTNGSRWKDQKYCRERSYLAHHFGTQTIALFAEESQACAFLSTVSLTSFPQFVSNCPKNK